MAADFLIGKELREMGNITMHNEINLFIKAPIELVYQFLVNVDNLVLYNNGLFDVEIINGKGEAGTIVKGKFVRMGVLSSLTIEVIEAQLTSEKFVFSSKARMGNGGAEMSCVGLAKDDGVELNAEAFITAPDDVSPDNEVFAKLMRNFDECDFRTVQLICEGMAKNMKQ